MLIRAGAGSRLLKEDLGSNHSLTAVTGTLGYNQNRCFANSFCALSARLYFLRNQNPHSRASWTRARHFLV